MFGQLLTSIDIWWLFVQWQLIPKGDSLGAIFIVVPTVYQQSFGPINLLSLIRRMTGDILTPPASLETLVA